MAQSLKNNGGGNKMRRKSVAGLAAVLLGLVLIGGTVMTASSDAGTNDGHRHNSAKNPDTGYSDSKVYSCPMHPDVRSDKPGKCPKCGMNLEAKQAASVREDPGICPVMHGEAKNEYAVTYKGKTYNLCCKECVEEFKSNPVKYISRIKEIKIESFRYGYTPNVIKDKQGDIVKLIISSRDVEHGVKIKDYKINVAVKKGEVKKAEFVAAKAGEFTITCPVYCGEGHADMKAKLIVEK